MRMDSTAVVQRRLESSDSLDDFPTPPWATRALCEHLTERNIIYKAMSCREPAANRGYMARTLEEYFHSVEASDIYDYGAGYPIKDYLDYDHEHVDWTITNPPFILAQEFLERAFATSDLGVAVILRIAFLEGKKRYENLFKYRPPSRVLQFVERVPMVKGRYDPDVSSATAYAWFVWQADWEGPTLLEWIPPCKDRLVRPDKDYV